MAKNTTQIIGTLTGGGDATLLQKTKLSDDLSDKIQALLDARNKLVTALQDNPPSPLALTAAIQDIDAEINLCLAVKHSLAGTTPIQFPSDEDMAALEKAVADLGNVTAQGAAAVALIPAIAKVISTFPA